MKKVAFVLPFFNEGEVIELFHSELVDATTLSDEFTYEFIYVNDGSEDDGLEKLLQLRKADARITVVNFSKNYGHEVAITAGLDFAREGGAEGVCIMDTDLQDPPVVAMAMIQRWSEGVDVVYGQRRKRQKESLFQKAGAHGFYWLLNKLSETDIPPHTSDFRVMDARVVEAVDSYRERERYIRGIVSDVGFNQEPFLFDRGERAAGKTHYTMGKLMALAATAIFGFSTYPLRLITKLGVLTSVVAAAYGLFAIVQKLFLGDFVRLPGYTFLLVAMLFLAGVQMLMLGVMGNYIGRIYKEVQQRPLYTVESIARSELKKDN